MIHLIYLMILILLGAFKITLNLASKTTKLRLKIHLFKFTRIKSKTEFFFKTKTGYKLEQLTRETMKLLGSPKKDVGQDKNSKETQKLESVEVVLVHCNLVKNEYQHTSKVLFNFVPNK